MRKSKEKKILIALLCIVALFVIAGGVISASVYESEIDKRYNSYEPLMFQLEDFEGLDRTRYEFPSDKGQKLTGYLYYAGSDQRGIIILAHGYGGGGHNAYMDCVNYFAQNGYYVFAFDVTGNDESEGDGVGGLPQAVVDLDHAISFVENSGKFPDLPIGLFGHSWGGYSVCSVLTYHPEVKAVIEASGFDRSSDIIESGGKKEFGNAIYIMMPFVKLYEEIKYGKYATNTALDGFEASDAAVMVVHSADDQFVPTSYGYDLYYKKYKDDPRFTFTLFEDRGHNGIFLDKDASYRDEFYEELDQWLDSLDYDYLAEENQKRFAKDEANFQKNHFAKAKWNSQLDEKLFEQFLRFYDRNM